MTSLDSISPQVVSIGTALFSAFIAISLAVSKLLITRFDNMAKAIIDQGKQMNNWLVDHEEKDQERHVQNLNRFENISVTLAKLGLK